MFVGYNIWASSLSSEYDAYFNSLELLTDIQDKFCDPNENDQDNVECWQVKKTAQKKTMGGDLYTIKNLPYTTTYALEVLYIWLIGLYIY